MNATIVTPGKGQKAMNTLFSVAQDEKQGVNIVWPDNSFTPLAGTMDTPSASAVVTLVPSPETVPAEPVAVEAAVSLADLDEANVDADAETVTGPDACMDDEKGPKHKGFLTAINTYPGCPLQGCITDGKENAMESNKSYGFHASSTRLLFNGRAETKAILDRLKWLTMDAKPGDLLFFGYSGHGALAQDRSPSGRVRGVRECICPVDFDWSPERMITDLQFVEIFSKLPRGVKLFWISDSCHSGGLDREMPRQHNSMPIKIPKFYPAPFDIRWGVEAAKAAGFVHSKCIREFINGELEVGFVPGCKTNQTSADTSADGIPCGALTHYFWDAVHSLAKSASVKQITDLARANLARDGYDQEPIASGALINGPWLQ